MTGAAADDGLALRRATAGDVPRLHEMVAAAGRAMAEQGFNNWLSPDPTERFVEDIATREVYVVVAAPPIKPRKGVRPYFDFSKWGLTPFATFTLGTTPRRRYSPEPWLDPRTPAFYLSRLAVDPASQGQGIGGCCLEQIERLARERGVRAVRCDVLTANVRLCRLYERFGYEARGKRSHSGWGFSCFERVID
jgi:ribosomal protein S18 acetylase RimI-like enzyme